VRWRRDGKELFYIARDGRLMAVPIENVPNAQLPEAGKPVALFLPPLGSAVPLGDPRHQYMVAPDGRQFLVVAVTEAPAAPISVIVNWTPKP
jgi:hypothetical protein